MGVENDPATMENSLVIPLLTKHRFTPSDHLRCELLTAVESINRFREQVDTMRHENESLKSSNTLLGKRLDKAAELFQQLNNQVAMLLNHTGLRYADVSAPTYHVNEPNVSPNK